MQIKAQRDELLASIDAVIGAVARDKTSMPALTHIWLKAEENALTLMATDLEIELSATVQVEVIEGGEITVPAAKMKNIVRGLTSSALITIQGGENESLIRSGRSRFKLGSISPEDFPKPESFESMQTVTVCEDVIKDLVDRTHFAMADNDVRYYLMGTYVELGAEDLRFVATNGHRLALADAKVSSGLTEKADMILPRKAILELRRLLDKTGEELSLSFNDKHAVFQLSTITLRTKLIDGRFPDYQRVIPQSTPLSMKTDTAMLRQVIQRVAILANKGQETIALKLLPNELTISSSNNQQESSEDVLEVEYEGHELHVGFNPAYIMEALAACQTPSCTFHLASEDASVMIKPEDDASSQHVLMPVRI